MSARTRRGPRGRAAASVGGPGADVASFRLGTALGPVTATFTRRGLVRLDVGARGAAARSGANPDRRARTLARELERYLSRGGWRFTVPLDLSAGTEFDRAVWAALGKIPFGETRTYGEVARAIGRPGAARAVGGACGRNPVIVIVPCHRVVAAGGIGGFGAGLPLKRRLLALEGIRV